MKSKPSILIFVDWFYPGYLAGGPVQSVVSLIYYLKDDFDFKVITTNRDLNSNSPYAGITPNQWLSSPLGCQVYYADPKTLNAKLIQELLTDTSYEKIYINSFFSRYFSIVPLELLNKLNLNKEILLAPRGMLGSGALAIKKWKKKLFILYSKSAQLHRQVKWHATSLQEANEIKKIIGESVKLVTIPNLPKKIARPAPKNKNANSLNLFFSSRISPKKNLLFALEVLKQTHTVPIRFTIYGLVEDEDYWEKCLKHIMDLPKTIQVKYKGSFHPDDIEKTYAEEHVLFLPTLNENYGHAIVECLLSGCPVIISDQTPWNDLEAGEAGYAFPLSQKEKFVTAIQQVAAMNKEDFQLKSNAAITYIRKKIDLEFILQQYRLLFNDPHKN